MNPLQFQKTVWSWWRENKRDFPWRNTRDPYKILVSEIMLQQTQTSRVEEKYRIFVNIFPNMTTLARSPLKKILRVWIGMGYNRRAKYLREISNITIEKWNGKLPKDPRILMTLPGIGHYTAHAVVCFAHGTCTPFLDTNIRRVIIHFFFPRKKQIRDIEIIEVLRRVEPKKRKRKWYLALMDYGAIAIPKSARNPNQRSRHWTKQSRFEGSTRQVRSLLVKDLLRNNSQTTASLKRSLDKEKIHPKFLETRHLIQILKGLERDELIVHKKGLWEVR